MATARLTPGSSATEACLVECGRALRRGRAGRPRPGQAADDEQWHRFGAATVVLLTADDDLADAATVEFDDEAQQAFAQARVDPAGSAPDRLRAWLDKIDGGTLSDGDVDPQVLWALEALEHWAGFLADRDPEFVVQPAIRSLEAVDFEVSASLDDFLASPAMAAEFDRIHRYLS